MKKQSDWSPEEELFAAILQNDETRFRELEPEVRQRLANMPKRSQGVAWYFRRVLPSPQVLFVAAFLMFGTLIAGISYRVGRGNGASYRSEYFAIEKEKAIWLQERQRLVQAQQNAGKDVLQAAIRARQDVQLMRSLQAKVSDQQKAIQSLTAGQIKTRTLYSVASSDLQQQTQLKNRLLDKLMLYKESEAAPHLRNVIGVTAGTNISDVEVLDDWKPQQPPAKLLRSNKVEFAWAPIPDAISYTVVVQRADDGTPILSSSGKYTHRVATLPDHGPPDKIQYYTWSLKIKRAGKTQLCITPRVELAIFDTARYQRFLLFEAARNLKSPQAKP